MSAGTIYCSQCGAPNEASANFCYRCGARLITPTPPAATGATGAGTSAGSSSWQEPVAAPSAASWPPPTGRFGTRPEEPAQEQARPPAARPEGTRPPTTWSGRSLPPTPAPHVALSTARYVVLAGVALLVVSCLWVMAAIGTHLSAGFGIFCLAPLGAIVLVVGLFLLLSRGASRPS